LPITETFAMRAFVISCAAALVLAVCGYAALNVVQKPADVAYSTSSVRI
jgi:hypothetical protein